MSTPITPTKPNRVGRPRKNPLDEQEWFGVFARMNEAERSYALRVMNTVHEALTSAAEQEQPDAQEAQG